MTDKADKTTAIATPEVRESRRQFPARSGLTGFYNAQNEWQCTGSAMGRREVRPEAPCKVRIRRVRLDSGGYDDGGAYWGTPGNLWQARGDDGESAVSLYCRANSKAEAIAAFASRPNVISAH